MKRLYLRGVSLAFALIVLSGCDLLKTESPTNTQNVETSDLQLPEQLEVVTNEN